MDNENSQEKTFDATPRRLEQLREQGQVLRSRDLVAALILGVTILIFFTLGEWMVRGIFAFMQSMLTIEQGALDNFDKNFWFYFSGILKIFLFVSPIFALIFLVALMSPFLLGGFIFSSKAIAFKGNRISPLQGIKRMFSGKSFIELFKAFIKVSFIMSFACVYLWQKRFEIMTLNDQPIELAVVHGLHLVEYTFLILVLALILLAAIDVPIQYFQFHQQHKMSLQEIKDEMKETDGNPQVKQQRRALAQQIIRQKLMTEIPKADVIVTNPEHYAVALKYESGKHRAPIVLAKGKGWIAKQIREIAGDHKIPLYSAPPLARSLYHTTEIGEEIPAGLYMAVALVLTYIYQLKRFHAQEGERPQMVSDLPIPEDLRFDS